MDHKKKIVEISGVNKVYGENHVVKNLTLDVCEGEFLTLLGSSGCGKTTTRMIAGFEEPTSGTICVEGENIDNKEPFERDVNTVFQSYALFPHMNIYDNIAYGLKMKKFLKRRFRGVCLRCWISCRWAVLRNVFRPSFRAGRNSVSPSPGPL